MTVPTVVVDKWVVVSDKVRLKPKSATCDQGGQVRGGGRGGGRYYSVQRGDRGQGRTSPSAIHHLYEAFKS